MELIEVGLKYKWDYISEVNMYTRILCNLLFLVILFFVIHVNSVSALSNLNENKEGNPAGKTEESFDKQLDEPASHKNRIILFGGLHNHFYGYTDKRYVGDDKGDYLSTKAQQIGIEYYTTDFSSLLPELRDARFGGNLAFYRYDEFPSRKLPAVPGLADEETVPADYFDRVSKFWLNIGFFMGYQKKWYGLDFGLTVVLRAYDEKFREKYVDYDAGTTEQAAGRGLIWDNARIYPNMHLRFGVETSPHFTLDILRGDYDAQYGFVQAKVVIPIISFFTLKLGGYLANTNAFFLEPTFSVYNVSLGIKVGTVLNYRDDHIERAGIEDSLIYSASIAYHW